MRDGPGVDGIAWERSGCVADCRMVGALSLERISRPDEAIANEIAPLSGGNTEATAAPKDAAPSPDAIRRQPQGLTCGTTCHTRFDCLHWPARSRSAPAPRCPIVRRLHH